MKSKSLKIVGVRLTLNLRGCTSPGTGMTFMACQVKSTCILGQIAK